MVDKIYSQIFWFKWTAIWCKWHIKRLIAWIQQQHHMQSMLHATQSALLNNQRQLSFRDKNVFFLPGFFPAKIQMIRTFVAMFIYHIFFVTSWPSFRSTCKAICERIPGDIKLNCYTKCKNRCNTYCGITQCWQFKMYSCLFDSQPTTGQQSRVDNMWL